MSQFRQDPLSGRWVIIAANRAQRPDEFVRQEDSRAATRCPFCSGNEIDTPHEIAAYCDPEDPVGNWQVRVVPNKFPAVELVDAGTQPSTSLYECRPGLGLQEVIIESPQHATSFSQLTDLQAKLTFRAYRDRLQAAGQNQRLAYATIFKNVGPWAGASIQHSHSQLLALPLVPNEVQRELHNAGQHYNRHGNCLCCQILQEELSAEIRIVTQTKNFVAFCPYASRFPYETWILPRQHASRFDETSASQLDELALLARGLVSSIESVVGRIEYNFIIHGTPQTAPVADHYHWRLTVFPRVTRPAGLEWGTDCFVNPLPPEDAAVELRGCLPGGMDS